MDVSIVIVNYNVKELLGECIDSIIRSLPTSEIIVVDNNSVDGSIKMLMDKYSFVKVISNKENVGFSKANNQGISIAINNYVLLLNPDTKIVDDALGAMLNFSIKQQPLSIVGPKLINENNSVQVSCWKFPRVTDIIAEVFFIHNILKLNQYSGQKTDSTLEVDFVSGAAMLFRKSLIEKIGMFDDKLFWMEDVDFCYRAKIEGAKVIYFPLTEIIHYSGESSKKNINASLSNQLISKIKFVKKHYSIFTALIASIFIFVHIISRIAIFFCLSLTGRNFKVKRSAYFYSLKKYFNYVINKDEGIT